VEPEDEMKQLVIISLIFGFLHGLSFGGDTQPHDSLASFSPDADSVLAHVFPQTAFWREFSVSDGAFVLKYPPNWEPKQNRVREYRKWNRIKRKQVVTLGPQDSDIEIIGINIEPNGFVRNHSKPGTNVGLYEVFYDRRKEFFRVYLGSNDPEMKSIFYKVLASMSYDAYFFRLSQHSESDSASVVSINASIGETAEWETYRSDAAGFEFKYPENFTVLGADDPCNYYTDQYCTPYVADHLNGLPEVTLEMSTTGFESSNLMYAYISVGLSDDVCALYWCPLPIPNMLINGVPFSRVYKSDSAMGGKHNSITMYRTFHGGYCYCVFAVVRSFGIGFTDAEIEAVKEGRLSEYDVDSLATRFEEIVSTFRFVE
jgi:hypothetical protein